ncbi:uncharacterized protein PF11_0213 [Anoplophora glabripennis]|uniref:uncharacterized protein PF11_0213 n=1 Tax=Anoplophora glabripennis TaxID=217634 RepID=UPI000873E3B7|nr:uncharacterized protein PF11_0213 [Anoplophora glabripennis]
MLSVLLWMVTEFDNTSSEVQHDQPPEDWSKLSFILRVFIPVAGLLILFRKKQIISRLLLQLDRNCVSVLCPSFSRREKLLKWAGSRLPETWSSQSRTLAGGVAELWSDGSLLCTLINSAIPGACPNPHRHWKKAPLHAQAIAYKYLGVIPIFTETDLKGSLTVTLERNFLHYLNELQQAITKLLERNDTPKSISIHYVVRGMGLYSGEQHRKAVFYVYPNANTTGQNSNIIIHIRGPYATYGKAVIPKFNSDLFATPEINILSDLQATKKLLNGNILTPKSTFMKNFSLPFMQYHKKHTGDNIVIDVAMEGDRAKVTYIPKNYGMYEIIMVANGELIRGCPFNVHILNNVSGIEDSFDGEEKVDDIPSLRRRKILSKTIDFIDEQMPIAEVLRKYKAKEENVEYEDKDTKSKTKIEEDEFDETRKLNGSVVPQTETTSVTQCIKNTQEEDDEDGNLLDNKINDCTDETDCNLADDESISEKQNSESTSENCKTKLNITNENNLIPSHKLNENNQTRGIIHKVNHYTDKSTHKALGNDLSVSLQLQSTNESTSDTKKLADVLQQRKQTYNVAVNTNSSKTSDDNQSRIEVNKLKIPERFCELQNTVNNKFSADVDTKYFKNVINTSNKRETPKRISKKLNDDRVKNVNRVNILQDTDKYPENLKNDDNNNNHTPNLNYSEARENVKALRVYQRDSNKDTPKIKTIPNKFLQTQQHLQNLEPPSGNPPITSPICPDHIVPEVENSYRKMSVAEKRKIFSKNTPDKISTSTNSSFSETENAEGSLSRPYFRQFEGLSVLNYLGSLKKSECTNKREPYPLSSTMSLPNISSMENGVFRNSVKERANFWEKLSSSSSSLSINSEESLKRKTHKLSEIERCKLIWKKPDENTASGTSISTIGENENVDKNEDIRKSADDILSITNFVPRDAPKKHKSMDHSLDKCTMMSIDERKKMLLKQNYEKEISGKQSPVSLRNVSIKENRKSYLNQKPKVINEDQNVDDVMVFSSIVDRIKKYDSVCNLSNNITEKQTSNTSYNNNADVKLAASPVSKDNSNTSLAATTSMSNAKEDIRVLPQTELLTVKSHFKRAIKYFKNLEEKSLNKSKARLKPKDCRRHSLNLLFDKYHKKGGSLNFSNIKQRFAVSNLYEDVFGDRRCNFKGAANRSALVEALATFSRNESRYFKEDEDKIIYEIFQKKSKTKRRKSIRSIFDIYY